MFLWCVFLLFSVHGFTAGASEAAPEKSFDTVFLVDSSNNVRNGEKLHMIRRFVTNLTLELIALGNHRVGIVSFSGLVYRVILPLTDDESQVNDHMLPVTTKDTGEYSYVDKALNYTFDEMFNQTARVGDGKQIVTILGGRPQNYDAITKMATYLKAKGLEMYSVGIGDDFFETTKDLRTLASQPVKEHTLRTRYSSLLKSTTLMMKKLKEAGYRGILKKKKIFGTKTRHKQHSKTIKSGRHRQVHSNTKIKHVKKRMNRIHGNTKNRQTKEASAKPGNVIIDATEENCEETEGHMVCRRNLGEVAQKRPELVDAATIATPPMAPADLGCLIEANSSPNNGDASCVGYAPAANRVMTDGNKVTGIVANNTVVQNDNRECDPDRQLEEGITMGDSGVDSTWDYGK